VRVNACATGPSPLTQPLASRGEGLFRGLEGYVQLHPLVLHRNLTPGVDTHTLTVTAVVPEPTTFARLGPGSLDLVRRRRRA